MAENTISEPHAHDVHALVSRVGMTSPAVPVPALMRAFAALKAQPQLHGGLYTPEQIASWRKVTGAIHAKGGRMFVQLWYVGCHGHGGEALAGIANDFRIAAAQAIAAGFDGVELHVNDGFLLEQFLKGDAVQLAQASDFSMEQRARLLLDVVAAVAREIGAERTGVVIAPPSAIEGAARSESDCRYSFIVGRLGVAYLRVAKGAANCPRDVTPFDCSLLDALLRPTELLGQPRAQPAAERSSVARACVEPVATRSFAASDGQDRRESNPVRKRNVGPAYALPIPDRTGRQVAADTPSSRVELHRQAALTA
jgi:NADH:flavin oxidoreductase / NADH oxidase family